jgi:6-phosphogluconolactonase
MGQVQLTQFESDDALAAAAAEAWLTAIAGAQAGNRKHLVALSGGRVVKKFFSCVVELARERGMSFRGVEFFWADERCVPPGDAESNFRLARESLFGPADIATSAIHRIQGELDAAVAAQRATAELRRVTRIEPPTMPVLDLVLLGMGEDGHVASLFPGDIPTEADGESVFRAVENSPKPPPCRVTLGYAPIAAAREAWVLASGQGKEAALRESLAPAGRTPLARVIQSRVVTRIFSDIAGF